MRIFAKDSLRWWIAIILAGSAALNYLDRQTLPILLGAIQKEIRFSTLQYSYVTAIFLAGYTALTAISGRLLDRVGTKRGLAIAVAVWSIASSVHSFCRNVLQFAAARLLLAIGESADFPSGVKGITERFPMEERAFAIGIFNSGASIGAAIGAPLISFTAVRFGWRLTFFMTGVLGALWLIIFLLVCKDPQAHEEPSARARPKRQYSILSLLGMRESWGCFVARIFIDPVTYFLIFWVPRYLQTSRGFTLEDIGRFLWAPYCALAVGTIVGGYIPGQLAKRGWTVNRARKSTMLVSSIVILASCITIVVTDSSLLVLVALGAFMFAHGAWGNITIPAEAFDSKVVGTISGIGGMMGGVAGVIGQVVLGYILQHHSFSPVFLCAGTLYLLAFVFLCVLIRRLGCPVSLVEQNAMA